MANKSNHPSPRLRHAVVDLLRGQGRPLHGAAIAKLLQGYKRRELSAALEALQFDGIIILGAGRQYRLAPGAAQQGGEMVEGLLSAHPRGFGFVRADGDDVFIPADAMAGAMQRDVVRARVLARSSRGREGEVVEVISRGVTRVAGLLRGKARAPWLEPDDARIRGPVEVAELPDGPAFEAGAAAVVSLTRYPENSRENPQGELLVVLGKPGEPDVEVAKLLLSHGIDEAHEEAAVAEAQGFGEQDLAAEIARREDLRAVDFLTIDPHDARDHDDAVCVTRDDFGNYVAWIAIADVSWFVRAGTALDAQASARGYSVYLPDRAIAMLPSQLSGGMCSLSKGCERLCVCLRVELDATGKPLRWRLIEGAMRSRAFLSYRGVARALGFTHEGERDFEAEDHRHSLRVLWDLAMLMRRRRMMRGALDLDLPEAAIVVDSETRKPTAVRKRAQDPGVKKAYRLVEEMMLLANECVAQEFASKQRAAIYRVHGPPNPDKLSRFAALCKQLDIAFDPDMVESPKKLAKVLRDTQNHPRAEVLHGVLLRALQQANYDTVNIGHFGLASSAYLHFTSPIRRYTDLLVHREVKRLLDKRPGSDEEALKGAALYASQQERRLMEAERSIADLYRAMFMREHLGEAFDGTIGSVSPSGLYVRLQDPFVSVLVPYDAVGRDAYEPDEFQLAAIGRRSGERLELGDDIHIIVEDVSLSRRAILGRRIIGADNEGRDAYQRPKRGRGGLPKGRGRGRKTKERAARAEVEVVEVGAVGGEAGRPRKTRRRAKTSRGTDTGASVVSGSRSRRTKAERLAKKRAKGKSSRSGSPRAPKKRRGK